MDNNQIPPEVYANLPPEVKKNIDIKTQAKNQNNTVSTKQIKPVKKKFPVTGCLIGFLFLYILSICLGIFILWLNKDNTTFLGNFQLLNDRDLKDFILTAIQWSFFPLAFIFFILTVIGSFILASAKKDQKDKKKKGLTMLLVNLLILVFIIPLWIIIYNFVNNLPVSGNIARIKAEIVLTPDVNEISKLQAPLTIEFSLKNIRAILNSKKLSIKKVLWDFDGNKKYETEINPNQDTVTRLINTKGTFTVNVKIFTDEKNYQEYSKTFTVNSAAFKATPDQGPAPLSIEFDATDLTRDQKISIYKWDFDDDKVFDIETKSPKTTYVFDKIGSYQINLQTVDQNSIINNYKKSVTIEKEEDIKLRPVIEITPSNEGNTPFQVQLSAKNSISTNSKIKKYEWNFGDGSPEKSGEKQNHIYKIPGKYVVVLTILDEQGNKENTKLDIIVRDKSSIPIAKINTTPTYNETKNLLEGVVPFKVNFDGSLSEDKDNNIVDYAWDFDGDNKYDKYGNIVEHIFRDPGSYQITLKVTDTDNQESIATINIMIKESETKAIISCKSPTNCSGPAPLTIEFDASQSTTSDNSDIVNYEWDFGDGSGVIPTGAITSHLYNYVGNYDVKLKIYSASGEEAVTTKKVFARVVPLQACFEASRVTGKAPLSVSFSSKCATGTIKNWKWSFGDGFISDNRNPTHKFSNPGIYKVKLEISDTKNNISKYDMDIKVEE